MPDLETQLRGIAPTPPAVPDGLEQRAWLAVSSRSAASTNGHRPGAHDGEVFWTTSVTALGEDTPAVTRRRVRTRSVLGGGLALAAAAVAIFAVISRSDLHAPTVKGTGKPGRVASATECVDAARMGRCFSWPAGDTGRYTFDTFTPQLTLTLPDGNHRNTAAFPDSITIVDGSAGGTLEVYANVVPVERSSCSSTLRPQEIDPTATMLAYSLAQRDGFRTTMPTGRVVATLAGNSITLQPALHRPCRASDEPMFAQSVKGEPDRVISLAEGQAAAVTFLDTGIGTTLAVVERSLGGAARLPGTTTRLDAIVRTIEVGPCVLATGAGRCQRPLPAPDSIHGLGKVYVESSCPTAGRGACFEPFGAGRYTFTRFAAQLTMSVPKGWRNDESWPDLVRLSYPAIPRATVTFYADMALDTPVKCRNDPGPQRGVVGAKAIAQALAVSSGVGSFSLGELPASVVRIDDRYHLFGACSTPRGGSVILSNGDRRVALGSPPLTSVVILAGTSEARVVAAVIQAPKAGFDRFWNLSMEIFGSITLAPCQPAAANAGPCEPVFARPSP